MKIEKNTARIEDMTKTIKGETVLSGVSMELFGGKIYGIVGKNGSGKTMLFRAISGLIRPDRGKIFWNGQYIKDSLQGVLRLGLVLENIGLHPDLSAQENLAYLAKINCYITKKEAIQTLSRVGLDPKNKKKVKTYSLGMRQKLVIAQAVKEHPDLLLLDEPTNALDAQSVERVRGIIREEAERGAIVVIASHNREDIDTLCDHVFYMKDGVLTEDRGDE